MKLKRIVSLLLCLVMIAFVVISNLQSLSVVQAAETNSAVEEESQYELEVEESEDETKVQETEGIIENETENTDDIQAVEESSDTYVEEEIQEDNEIIEDENSFAREVTGSIAINETNFPDSVFRAIVRDFLDSNGDNALSESERNAVINIGVGWRDLNNKIKNIQGIEFFPNLEYLDCSGNNLTSLDVSKNTALKTLWCVSNNLTSLDVSKNTALKTLWCSSNNLTSLNVNSATKLDTLECGNNNLTSLDVSKNTELTELYCSNNKLTSLTGVQNLTNLYNLFVSNNLLTVLPDMTRLTNLGPYYNGVRFVSFENNYLSESELRSKLPSHLLNLTDWLQTQIDSQYKIAEPTALTLSIPSASSIKISWTKATGVTGYEIWYATSKNGTYEKLKTTTGSSYTHTELKAGSTYYYKIRSYITVSDTKVYGSYTAPKSKVMMQIPSNVKLANSSATSIKVSWSKVTNASGYEIYRATSKNGTYKNIKTITSGTTTSYANKNLTNNKTYYYKVRAYKTVNGTKKYGSYCSILSKKVVLAKTTLTAATKSKTSIKLSWTKVSGATKYEIYRSTSKNGTYKKIKTVTAVSYTNTKLTSNKTYYYKVKAVQGSYKSAYSAVQSTKTTK